MLDLEMGGWPNRLHVAMLREITSLEEMTVVANRSQPGRTLPGILREAEANMKGFRRFGSAISELLIFDGYHPNELGHAALAVAVQQALPFES